MRHNVLATLCILVLVLTALTCLASPAKAAPSDDAEQHFQAGTRAFDEQRLADAAREFEQAYAMNPLWQVLYNIGMAHAALGRPVDAVERLERYLSDGGAAIDSERRLAVEAELERQRAKVGKLDVRISHPGAEVRIDAKAAGRSPLATSLSVAEGTHAIDVTLDGHRPEHREISVHGRQEVVVQVTLQPLRPSVQTAPPRVSTADQVALSEWRTGQRLAGCAIGGAGLIALGVGIGITADGYAKDAKARDSIGADYAEARKLHADANRKKIIGPAVAGIGGAALATGFILLLSAPTGLEPRTALQLEPSFSTAHAELHLKGKW
jgi:tetratricopeptide (TPR) repeat protein